MNKLLLALTLTIFSLGALACPGDKNKPKDPAPDQRIEFFTVR